MRIDSIPLQEIIFPYTTYDDLIKASLLRVGQNFPIYVKRSGQGFICRDGKKRLSAIQDILQEDPKHIRFQTIKVIIEDGARTAPPYSLHNHH